MAPVEELDELVLGVLGVVDEQVRVAAQVEDGRGDGRPVERRLVVGQVGHGHAVGLDPEPEGVADVRDRPDRDGDGAQRELVVGAEVVVTQLAPEVGHVHGEERWLHHPRHRLLEGVRGLGRAVDLEQGTGIAHRREERGPQDVVVVEVGEQGVAPQRPAGGDQRCIEVMAQRPQAGPHVEDQGRLAVHLDQDA